MKYVTAVTGKRDPSTITLGEVGAVAPQAVAAATRAIAYLSQANEHIEPADVAADALHAAAPLLAAHWRLAEITAERDDLLAILGKVLRHELVHDADVARVQAYLSDALDRVERVDA